MTEPEFLDLEDVLVIHDEQLARYGGAGGVRDLGLLESAIGMPRSTFGGLFVHEGIFAMAAAYAFHIAERRLDKSGLAGVLEQLARPVADEGAPG